MSELLVAEIPPEKAKAAGSEEGGAGAASVTLKKVRVMSCPGAAKTMWRLFVPEVIFTGLAEVMLTLRPNVRGAVSTMSFESSMVSTEGSSSAVCRLCWSNADWVE